MSETKEAKVVKPLDFEAERESLFYQFTHIKENIISLIESRDLVEQKKQHLKALMDDLTLKEKEGVNNAIDPSTEKPKYGNAEKRDIALTLALKSNEQYQELKEKFDELVKTTVANSDAMRIAEWNYKIAREQTTLVTGGRK